MFYDKFIQLCDEHGKKPTPVALELGFVSSNVAQWKKGSTPRAKALEKIANYFDVPVSYFFETDDHIHEKTKNPTTNGEDDELFEIIGTLSAKDKRKVYEFIKLLKD